MNRMISKLTSFSFRWTNNVEQTKYDAHKGLRSLLFTHFFLQILQQKTWSFHKKLTWRRRKKKFIDEKLANFYIEQFKVLFRQWPAAVEKVGFHIITITSFNVLFMYCVTCDCGWPFLPIEKFLLLSKAQIFVMFLHFILQHSNQKQHLN